MRLVGYLLLACVVLAIVKVAVAALLVVLVVGLLWSAATRPRETAALFGLLIITGLIQNHGLAFLSVVGIAMIAQSLGRMPSSARQSAKHPALSPPRPTRGSSPEH